MIRIFGAALLMAGCAGFCFSIASAHRREIRLLRSLINAIQEMVWELKYRMPDLKDLCILAGDVSGGILKDIFKELAGRIDRREIADISGSFNEIVRRFDLPRSVRKNLIQLGAILGRYDLEGQIQGMDTVRRQCKMDLQRLEENSAQRVRSYQTLALCAGAALIIIFI